MKRSKDQEAARKEASRKWIIEAHQRLVRRAEEVELMRIELRKDAERYGFVELLDELEAQP